MRNSVVALIILWTAYALGVPTRYPMLMGDQTRIEVLLLPEVTTGPLDPEWSARRTLDRLLDEGRYLESARRRRRGARPR